MYINKFMHWVEWMWNEYKKEHKIHVNDHRSHRVISDSTPAQQQPPHQQRQQRNQESQK